MHFLVHCTSKEIKRNKDCIESRKGHFGTLFKQCIVSYYFSYYCTVLFYDIAPLQYVIWALYCTYTYDLCYKLGTTEWAAHKCRSVKKEGSVNWLGLAGCLLLLVAFAGLSWSSGQDERRDERTQKFICAISSFIPRRGNKLDTLQFGREKLRHTAFCILYILSSSIKLFISKTGIFINSRTFFG